jgi:hypothetical protein
MRKVRDGSDQGPALCYRFRSRLLGSNEYGEPVTAVVVEHLADEAQTATKKELSPKARAALGVLWDCIKDPARSWPLPDGPGLRCATIEVWEAACLAPGAISNATKGWDRAMKFRAARKELEEVRAVICDGERGERVRPAPRRVTTGHDDGEPS